MHVSWSRVLVESQLADHDGAGAGMVRDGLGEVP